MRNRHWREQKLNRRIALVGILTFLSFGVLCAGCKPYNKRYVAERKDLEPNVREAILQKRVVLGMFPDEAQAAAGSR